jgi:hypothetical protein
MKRSIQKLKRNPEEYFIEHLMKFTSGKIVLLILLLSSKALLACYLVDSKGFWRWFITLRITGFMDFVYRPVF